MAANRDAAQLKGIEIIPWEKSGKAAAAQLDTESKFDQFQYFAITVDSTNYGSYFTSSYDFLFTLTGISYMFSQIPPKKKKWTLRSPRCLEPCQES